MILKLELKMEEISNEFEANKLFFEKAIAELSAKCESTQTRSQILFDEKEVANLRKENAELKKENQALLERVNNLAYILADLQNQVKVTQEEMASLITTIRLLHNDITTRTNNSDLTDDKSEVQSEVQWTNIEGQQKPSTVDRHFRSLRAWTYLKIDE